MFRNMAETKKIEEFCTRCFKTQVLNIKAKSYLYGSDGLDRMNCWNNCWICKRKNVCVNCSCTCSKCGHVYCKYDCFIEHRYKDIILEKICPICNINKKNIIAEVDACGFDWKLKKKILD